MVADGKVVDGDSPGGRTLRPRRWRSWIAWGLAGVGVLLGGAYALRAQLLAPVLVRVLRERVRRDLGAELGIERITGSWYDDLTLEGLSWSSSSSPLRRLEQARVEAHYSLVELARGEPGWLHSLSLRGSGLEVLVEEQPDEAAPAAEPAEGGTDLELPRLEVELDGIDLAFGAQGRLHLDRLEGAAGLRRGVVRVRRLETSAGDNRVTLAGVTVDSLAGGPIELLRAAQGALQVQLHQPAALGEPLGRQLAPLQSADLNLELRRGTAHVTGDVLLEGGRLAVQEGELRLPRSSDLLQAMLDLRMEADFADLEPLGRLLGQPTLQGRWLGDLDLQGRVGAPIGHFVGSAEGLEIPAGEGRLTLDRVDLDIRVDGERVRIARLSAQGPELGIRGSGSLRLEPLELEGISLDVDAESSAALPWVPYPCRRLSGHARLSGPPTRLRGDFELSAGQVNLGAFELEQARVVGRLDGEHVGLQLLEVTAVDALVRLSGALTWAQAGVTATLESLQVDWKGTSSVIDRPARIEIGPERLAIEGVRLRSRGSNADRGEGTAQIDVVRADGVTRCELHLADFDAGALLAPLLPQDWSAGRIRGEVTGELGSAAPVLEIDLALDDWSLGQAWPGLAARLKGRLAGERLVLDDFELETAMAEHLQGSLAAPFDLLHPTALAPGEVEARLSLDVKDGKALLRRQGIELPQVDSGPFTLGADLKGGWDALHGTVRIALPRLRLGELGEQSIGRLNAELELDDALRLSRLDFVTPGGEAHGQGSLGVSGDLQRILDGAWREAPLELSLDLDLPDVAWLASLSPDVRRLAGRVAGRFALTGTPSAPLPTGRLTWEEGELRLASDFPPVRELQAVLVFEDESLRIEDLSGVIGGAPCKLSGTLAVFEPSPVLDLALAGQNLLLARSAQLRLRADADLRITGPLEHLRVAGQVSLTEGRYTGEIKILERLRELSRRTAPAKPEPVVFWRDPPLAAAAFDVRVTSARGVSIETNLFKASLRPDLRLLGTGAAPTAEGAVYIENASLSLPSGRMNLVSGAAQLRREAPFRPEGALTGEQRVLSYDVRLTVVGGLDEMEVVLSSTPPLPSDDLWILVLTGQPPVSDSRDRNTQAMESLAYFLARDQLVRWFTNSDSGAIEALDRFEFDIGATSSQTGKPTGRVLFYLRPNTSRSSRATYLTGELDEYDRYNFALGIVFRPR